MIVECVAISVAKTTGHTIEEYALPQNMLGDKQEQHYIHLMHLAG